MLNVRTMVRSRTTLSVADAMAHKLPTGPRTPLEGAASPRRRCSDDDAPDTLFRRRISDPVHGHITAGILTAEPR
jgi:hypothetical protein